MNPGSKKNGLVNTLLFENLQYLTLEDQIYIYDIILFTNVHNFNIQFALLSNTFMYLFKKFRENNDGNLHFESSSQTQSLDFLTCKNPY